MAAIVDMSALERHVAMETISLPPPCDIIRTCLGFFKTDSDNLGPTRADTWT